MVPRVGRSGCVFCGESVSEDRTTEKRAYGESWLFGSQGLESHIVDEAIPQRLLAATEWVGLSTLPKLKLEWLCS